MDRRYRQGSQRDMGQRHEPNIMQQRYNYFEASLTGLRGLGSRIRDTMDLLLGALDLERTVIHEGSNICPSEGNYDPFMLCLFEPFSACQGKLISTEEGILCYAHILLTKALDRWCELMLNH